MAAKKHNRFLYLMHAVDGGTSPGSWPVAFSLQKVLTKYLSSGFSVDIE